MRYLAAIAYVALLSGCKVYDPPEQNPGSRPGASGVAGSGGANVDTGAGASASGGSSDTAGGAGSTMPTTGGPGGTDGSSGASGAGGHGASLGSTGGRQNADAAAEAAPRDGATDAAVVSDATADATNCAGYALYFNGGTYAALSRPVQDDFTIEAWIKTSASLTGTGYFNGRGLIYADVAGPANDFGSSILNDKFAFGVGNPDTTLQSTTTVTTDQWIHVAATRQRSTGEIRIIVNGASEVSATPNQTRSLTAQSILTVGGNTIDGRYFMGYLDEVRIWSIVRSPAEIGLTMGQRLNGNEAGLVSYFRFDEGSGAVAKDSSARSVDASLVGAPVWVPSGAPICGPTGL